MNEHIVSLSGGKDSSVMLLKMIELNYKIDKIIFADTTLELPEMYEWINFLEKYIKRKIIRTIPKYTFDEWFYGKFTKGINKGKMRGFPLPFGKACHLRGTFKIGNITKLQKRNDIIYIGFAFDEWKRANYKIYSNKEKYKFPLITWKMTEQDCIQYLKNNNFPFPFYNVKRTGCWLCPQQNKNSLKILWENHPELWKKLKKYEKDSPTPFNNNKTLLDFEIQFKKENEQLTIFN